MGLKQGCILSPQFFTICINGLTDRINDLKCGVKFDDEQISILLYANDIDCYLIMKNIYNAC